MRYNYDDFWSGCFDIKSIRNLILRNLLLTYLFFRRKVWDQILQCF